MPAIIGQALTRKEDARLLTGSSCYGDDFSLPNQAYAVFVRSPHAHARIRSIDTRVACGMPRILAVLTGFDANVDALAPIRTRRFRLGRRPI
jgi:aerobic carbon-monoxide dehydrogenase large subunit